MAQPFHFQQVISFYPSLSDSPAEAAPRPGAAVDEALQLVIEMNELIWNHFKRDLDDVTPEEINWRPLPPANTINAILRQLRVEAQLELVSLERGEQSLRWGP